MNTPEEARLHDAEADARRLLAALKDDCDSSSDDPQECECAVCKDGTEAVEKRQQEAMEKHGWYAHFIVGDDPASPTGFNYHTHGFTDTFHQPDLQAVLPLDPKVVHDIFAEIADRLREGTKFVVGKPIGDIVRGGYKIMFAIAHESDRVVWRLIIPDPHGNLLKETVEGLFAEQWEGCEAANED